MLKKTEKLILANLRNNCRESLTKISRKTAIPVSTIYDRLKHYEGSVIKKYTMIVDFGKLGFNTRVTMSIKTAKDYRDGLKDFLINNKSVNTVYKLSTGYDFMIEGIFKEFKDLEVFLDRLEGEFMVTEKCIYYIVDELKKEGFMSSPEYVRITGDFV